MRDNGRPIDQALRLAELNAPPWEQPDRPIAFHSGMRFLQDLALREGPDIGHRVVSEASLSEIGLLSRITAAAETPREALGLLTVAMARHSTHENISVARVSGGMMLREQLLFQSEPELRHVEQQYVAALVRALCRATGYRGEPLEQVEMTPHPVAGLSGMWNGPGMHVVASTTRTLSIFIPDKVLDLPFRPQIRGQMPVDGCEPTWGRGFVSTARVYIENMLDGGEQSIDRFAAAAGLSRRTLQRRLSDEGTSYSALLDEVRRNRALRGLAEGSSRIGDIAADLGYSGQPAFHRAVRRWATVSPSELRRLGGAGVADRPALVPGRLSEPGAKQPRTRSASRADP
ncbi:AraC family transcriptional regulator [Tropicimonas sp. IMCC34043]|uniref:AraC family transcriptional regulator n=1 Tax=Tropicimonas sp. IMCC34043 TaxID=2248760 RepID=UPI0018E4EA00|nr:AraC family transcriptional regulator [Tropicimonas sp. IMCC34043]